METKLETFIWTCMNSWIAGRYFPILPKCIYVQFNQMSRGCYDDVNDFSRKWGLRNSCDSSMANTMCGAHYGQKKKIGFYRLKMAEVAISDTSEALDKDGHAHRAHCKGFCLFLHAAFGLLLLDVAKPSLQVKRLCKNGAQYAQWSSALGSLGLPWCTLKGLRGMASSWSQGIPFLPHITLRLMFVDFLMIFSYLFWPHSKLVLPMVRFVDLALRPLARKIGAKNMT